MNITNEIRNNLKNSVESLRVNDLQDLLQSLGRPKGSGPKSNYLSRVHAIIDNELTSAIVQKFYAVIRQRNPTAFRLLEQNTRSVGPSTTSHVTSTSSLPLYGPVLPGNSRAITVAPSSQSSSLSRVSNALASASYSPRLNISFARLPFYDLIDVLLQPYRLTYHSSTRSTQSQHDVQFTLNEAQFIQFRNGMRGSGVDATHVVQVQLRLCQHATTSHHAEVPDNLPPNLIIKVNNENVALPAPKPCRPGDEPKRPGLPIDISKHVRSTAGLVNYVTIQWHTVGQMMEYCVCVNLVTKRTPEELYQRLIDKGMRPRKLTHDLLMRNFRGDGDIVAITSDRVKLVDPLSMSRIQTPIRSNDCRHVTCFDAMSYLRMNEKKPAWLCPVCNQVASYQSLQIDEFINAILKATSANEVVFGPDGNWSDVKMEATTLLDSDSEDEAPKKQAPALPPPPPPPQRSAPAPVPNQTVSVAPAPPKPPEPPVQSRIEPPRPVVAAASTSRSAPPPPIAPPQAKAPDNIAKPVSNSSIASSSHTVSSILTREAPPKTTQPAAPPAPVVAPIQPIQRQQQQQQSREAPPGKQWCEGCKKYHDIQQPKPLPPGPSFIDLTASDEDEGDDDSHHHHHQQQHHTPVPTESSIKVAANVTVTTAAASSGAILSTASTVVATKPAQETRGQKRASSSSTSSYRRRKERRVYLEEEEDEDADNTEEDEGTEETEMPSDAEEELAREEGEISNDEPLSRRIRSLRRNARRPARVDDSTSSDTAETEPEQEQSSQSLDQTPPKVSLSGRGNSGSAVTSTTAPTRRGDAMDDRPAVNVATVTNSRMQGEGNNMQQPISSQLASIAPVWHSSNGPPQQQSIQSGQPPPPLQAMVRPVGSNARAPPPTSVSSPAGVQPIFGGNQSAMFVGYQHQGQQAWQNNPRPPNSITLQQPPPPPAHSRPPLSSDNSSGTGSPMAWQQQQPQQQPQQRLAPPPPSTFVSHLMPFQVANPPSMILSGGGGGRGRTPTTTLPLYHHTPSPSPSSQPPPLFSFDNPAGNNNGPLPQMPRQSPQGGVVQGSPSGFPNSQFRTMAQHF